MNTTVNSLPATDSNAKTHALIAYCLLLVGLFTAIPMIIGAIWAMVKKSDAAGTLYHSHYRNAIKTFWWSLLWTVIGMILTVALVGYLILVVTWVWAFYRLVKGVARITSDEPYLF